MSEPEIRPGCRETFARIDAWQLHNGKKINDMHEALVGNGDMRNSLVTRVADLEGQARGSTRTWKVLAVGATIVAALAALTK